MIHRFSVYLADFDPAVGSEIQKIRPCVVLSPDEMNGFLHTVIVAPLTSTSKRWPSRVPCKFDGRNGEVALDQLRTLDKSRLLKHLGSIDARTASLIREALLHIFS